MCIWFQEYAPLRPESTVPMHPQLQLFTLQLFLDVQQCRLVLPSPLALPFFMALASLRAVASLLALASLLVLADLFQGSHSQAETHMRGERVRHKIASREGRASSVVAHRPLS